MREVRLSGVDLNLLPALDALLRRKNVSLAARDVGLSQPAMSRALGRLRSVLGDELLVRSTGGFALTPRAMRLGPVVASSLREIAAVYSDQMFDPRTMQGVVRIAASDHQTVMLVPALMARLSEEAPRLDVRIQAYSPDTAQRIEDGTLDLAFATRGVPLPAGAQSEGIARYDLALVMRRNHPAAGIDWTIEDYALHDHVTIGLFGDGSSSLDAELALLGLTRRIALTTPHFMAAIATVSKTDLVTTIDRHLATMFAQSFGLVVKDTPFQSNDHELTLVWSHIRNNDPLIQWMRSLVSRTARELGR